MPGCFWYPLCLVVYSCLLQGSVVLWLHMSPHNVCALRAVIFLVRSVHILWAPCLCIHSFICVRLSWCAIHHNSMQGPFLRISSLPSWLLYRSSALGFWGDVVRAAFQHIRSQNHPLSRKIGWGAIYGAIEQLLRLPCSIVPSHVTYVVGHWWGCLTAVRHRIHGESQNKSINSGPIAWDYIPQWILG